MSLILIASEQFSEHETPPGHPESPARSDVMQAVAGRWRLGGGEVVAPRLASDEQLLRVHSAAHLRRIEATAGFALVLDPDTYTSPESSVVARLAAGAAVDAVERVMAGVDQRALALVRPPGHHAERDRAMGFCLFNNAAVAAAHARTLGADRVAIVDFDVHHGNGTQHMFEHDRAVLSVSMHQYPFYPGTGAADETGTGGGRGYSVNLPLEVGAADEDYRIIFAEVVDPVLERFRPDVILVSAGFDAHERDPIAGMRLTTGAFAAMTAQLRSAADRLCAGRLAAVTEGGYDLRAFEDSLLAVIDVLGSPTAPAPAWPVARFAPTRARAAIAACKQALGDVWGL
jgi:acetoin utilization deacetylase AcuC-like enzyme